jgi:hypothetical protein
MVDGGRADGWTGGQVGGDGTGGDSVKWTRRSGVYRNGQCLSISSLEEMSKRRCSVHLDASLGIMFPELFIRVPNRQSPQCHDGRLKITSLAPLLGEAPPIVCPYPSLPVRPCIARWARGCLPSRCTR